jgi:hypothetical protein
MSMSRRVAIIVTAVTAMLFGIPALGLTCFGTYMAVSTKIPSLMEESRSSKELTLAVGIFIALFGLGVLLLIVGVGIFSIRFSRPDQAIVDESEAPPSLPERF